MAFDPASLKYNDQGLIPAIAQDESGDVLMMAWMNTQALVEMRVDCDRDCLLLVVRQDGPACHTNRRSCFFTAVRDGREVEILSPIRD